MKLPALRIANLANLLAMLPTPALPTPNPGDPRHKLNAPPVRSRIAPPEKTRQLVRQLLFGFAFGQVTGQHSHKVGNHWFVSMARSERRKLARAFAAGEWRRQSPETRGIKPKKFVRVPLSLLADALPYAAEA